jgi:hypothetical protein
MIAENPSMRLGAHKREHLRGLMLSAELLAIIWRVGRIEPTCPAYAPSPQFNSLNKMRTRGCRVEPVGEILRFVGHQSFAELHDTHHI